MAPPRERIQKLFNIVFDPRYKTLFKGSKITKSQLNKARIKVIAENIESLSKVSEYVCKELGKHRELCTEMFRELDNALDPKSVDDVLIAINLLEYLRECLDRCKADVRGLDQLIEYFINPEVRGGGRG